MITITIDGKQIQTEEGTSVLEAALHHPLTDAGIARFKADWEKSGLKE